MNKIIIALLALALTACSGGGGGGDGHNDPAAPNVETAGDIMPDSSWVEGGGGSRYYLENDLLNEGDALYWDRKTGLLWDGFPPGGFTYAEAALECRSRGMKIASKAEIDYLISAGDYFQPDSYDTIWTRASAQLLATDRAPTAHFPDIRDSSFNVEMISPTDEASVQCFYDTGYPYPENIDITDDVNVVDPGNGNTGAGTGGTIITSEDLFIDNRTGLSWLNKYVTNIQYYDAELACEETGMRLPTITEARTIPGTPYENNFGINQVYWIDTPDTRLSVQKGDTAYASVNGVVQWEWSWVTDYNNATCVMDTP